MQEGKDPSIQWTGPDCSPLFQATDDHDVVEMESDECLSWNGKPLENKKYCYQFQHNELEATENYNHVSCRWWPLEEWTLQPWREASV